MEVIIVHLNYVVYANDDYKESLLLFDTREGRGRGGVLVERF